MKILIDIGHPAHAHFFKYFIRSMQKKGHDIKITAKDKDITLKLLDLFNLEYLSLGIYRKKMLPKFIDLLRMDCSLYNLCKKFNPDVILSFGSVNAAHVSFIANKPGIFFDDDEYSYRLYNLFASAICTTHTFKLDLGKKHIKFDGYKELAYLHPNHFIPDPSELEALGINPGEDFIIMRFVGWNALHDVGKQGLENKTKLDYVKKLEKYARVFISSENPLPSELEKYKINLSPDKIHHALYFAKLLIGDTQTMTTEAAILGTPAIRCNSFVGDNDMLNFVELEQRYKLIFNYQDPQTALEKAIELVQDPDLKGAWKRKRDKMLGDKIDVTSFMIWFVENYPESLHIMKRNPFFQYQFV